MVLGRPRGPPVRAPLPRGFACETGNFFLSARRSWLVSGPFWPANSGLLRPAARPCVRHFVAVALAVRYYWRGGDAQVADVQDRSLLLNRFFAFFLSGSRSSRGPVGG